MYSIRCCAQLKIEFGFQSLIIIYILKIFIQIIYKFHSDIYISIVETILCIVNKLTVFKKRNIRCIVLLHFAVILILNKLLHILYIYKKLFFAIFSFLFLIQLALFTWLHIFFTVFHFFGFSFQSRPQIMTCFVNKKLRVKRRVNFLTDFNFQT